MREGGTGETEGSEEAHRVSERWGWLVGCDMVWEGASGGNGWWGMLWYGKERAMRVGGGV